LRLAVVRRRQALLDAQAALNMVATKMLDDDRKVRKSCVGHINVPLDIATLRILETADFETHIRQLELVELAYDHVNDEIDDMKNSVLLGWGGDGLFELNHALVMRYVTESILNLGFLSQALTFD